MKLNKKAQLISALNELPAAVLAFTIFALVLVIAFKIIVGIQATMTVPAGGTSAIDNWTYNNITLVANSLSNFTSNAGLIAVITVMAIVLMIVIAAFSFRRFKQ